MSWIAGDGSRRARIRGRAAARKGRPRWQPSSARPDYHEICGMIEPDPTDSTVSKRKWEKSVQLWRKALRDDMAASNGQDMEDLSIDGVVIDDPLQWLCGHWADQTGSSYNVTRSGENCFDIFTMRPTGEIIYTKGLIKARGARVVWGNNRYELRRSDIHALEWRARDETDKFFWCRI